MENSAVIDEIGSNWDKYINFSLEIALVIPASIEWNMFTDNSADNESMVDSK